MNGLIFEVSINGITKDIFSLIKYLPNIIFELTNISYNESNNSTNITGATWFVKFECKHGISLPLQKSNLISNFNIGTIISFYFTLKQGYRLDCVDVNNSILFSYTNISNDYVYYIPIVFNINMIKVNI